MAERGRPKCPLTEKCSRLARALGSLQNPCNGRFMLLPTSLYTHLLGKIKRTYKQRTQSVMWLPNNPLSHEQNSNPREERMGGGEKNKKTTYR